MTTELDFYRSQSHFTDPDPVDGALLQGLPSTAEDLSTISSGLVVHEFLAHAYEAGDISGRAEELENRTFAEIVEAITTHDPRPLSETREPTDRIVGNCRQHALVTCALLRHAGIPARVRAGFSGYFDDTWVDHWIVERWDGAGEVWIRTDSQLDEVQKELFQIDFDPMRVPADAFLTGSEAWQVCRGGDDDPERFGIQDMRGWWFVACNMIRDLAALNKVELHVWDTWGVMDEMVFNQLKPEQIELMDRVAEGVTTGDLNWIRSIYEHGDLVAPDVVTSHRFQRTVRVQAS